MIICLLVTPQTVVRQASARPINIFAFSNVRTAPAAKVQVRKFSSSPVLFANSLDEHDIYDLVVSGFLSKVIINQFVEGFWEGVMNKLNENQYVIFMCKIEYANGRYLTLGQVHRINKEDKEEILESLEYLYFQKNEEYKSMEIIKIVGQYWVKNNSSNTPIYLLSTLKDIKKINNPEKILNNYHKKFSMENIPLNRDYLNWGEVSINNENTFLIIQDKIDVNKTYVINNFPKKGYSEIEVRIAKKTQVFTTKFIDRQPEDKNYFVRTVGNYEFYIHNNEEINILKTIKFKTEHLQVLKKEKKIS